MSTNSLSSKIDKAARLLAALTLAATFVVFAADRAAVGCGGGGGGGGGGRHAAAPASDDSFQPKKMSPGDRAKMTKMIQTGQKIVTENGKLRDWDTPSWQARNGPFVDQATQLLDELDKKGYDTDPEYESDVYKLKSELSAPQGASSAYGPPAVGPGAPGVGFGSAPK
jgi:hypothetical protein